MIYNILRGNNMNVSLTRELDQWINQKVESGLYKSSSEVIRDSLRLLRRQEDQREAMIEDLRHELLIGIKQLDSGESVELDSNLIKIIKESGRQKV
ncbi:MAG: type II toxin-antitoxin system ParD family antitoxin [Spirochaetales bacterium]|nr:type II toxin-antitoxin system ParD family antitoxin [Spirochaetales bacterium]